MSRVNVNNDQGTSLPVQTPKDNLDQNKNDAVIQALTEKMLNPTSLTIQPKKPTLSPQLIEKLYPGLIGSYDVSNR